MDTRGGNKHEIARMLLKWKYEDIWGRELPEIAVTETGKPYFVDAPGYFSISYTGSLCCCALCDSPVGVDIERIRNVSYNAVKGVLSPAEWMQYSISENPSETFMRFWTLKEAYCKFTGLGIAGTKLKETEFDCSGSEPSALFRNDLHFWCRKIDDEEGGFVLSLCTDRLYRPEFYMETF